MFMRYKNDKENFWKLKKRQVRFHVREFGGDPYKPLYAWQSLDEEEQNPNFKCFIHQDGDNWI